MDPTTRTGHRTARINYHHHPHRLLAPDDDANPA
jgi:hypothetical protein